MKTKTCAAIDDTGKCPAEASVGDLCLKHYTRHRRTGSFSARQPRDLGASHVVSYPLPTEHHAKVAKLAKERCVSEATILREAVKIFLEAVAVVRRKANS